MKIINKIMVMFAILLVVSSCEDENRLPLVVLDTVEKGAYPRLIDQTDKLINLFDIAGSSYTYNIEFVDEEGGALVSQYVLDLVYDDNDPSNGDNSSGPNEYLVIPSSAFSQGANGFLQAPTISISGSDALAAAGVSADQVTAGDNFNFVGRVELTDGRTFSQSNSSATVVGPAFQGHFNFTMPASCPSDLTGTYDYTTTNMWCDASASISGTVDVEALGGGVYNLSDWALGSYVTCYGGGTAGGSMSFTDVCLEVTVNSGVDGFGDTWTFESSVSGNEWTIDYVNTYGESASSILFYPGGADWPITVK
tara:strand:- start:1889 stop:2815 length:927 start_codon:yes stop_codon:yes gene_type:complete